MVTTISMLFVCMMFLHDDQVNLEFMHAEGGKPLLTTNIKDEMNPDE